MDFAGRHVVVTGASTGIGRATAEHILGSGGKVTLIARSADRLAELRELHGDAAHVAPADVADAEGLTAALDAAEAFAPIDGLFCNAGTGGSFAPLEDYAADDFDALMAVNMLGALRAVQQVYPRMKARRKGAILITGSLASERGMAMNVAYVMSKHAVLGLARAAAVEGAPFGVRANCLIPGFIDTPLMDGIPPEQLGHLAQKVPQLRLGSSAETAAVAAFLLSDAASHVTGQSWAVDGGVLGTLRV
ncbi:MAG: SDR family oxidoreductase [Sphingomonadales bacterium]|nr:SDR family oxidoreductase [Sphingomonadales bacterium]MBD3773544.1 SDR family oxidoreductase [Paracoccaceae bacterium]